VIYQSIRFTKKGERSHLAFDGEPMEDGSIILQVKHGEDGTDVNLGERIPDEDAVKYFPIFGLRFYQKESVISLRKACEGIIKWFEKQEQKGADQ
jgi:hypothetical protein